MAEPGSGIVKSGGAFFSAMRGCLGLVRRVSETSVGGPSSSSSRGRKGMRGYEESA